MFPYAGSIPPELGNLHGLKRLSLNRNALSGEGDFPPPQSCGCVVFVILLLMLLLPFLSLS